MENKEIWDISKPTLSTTKILGKTVHFEIQSSKADHPDCTSLYFATIINLPAWQGRQTWIQPPTCQPGGPDIWIYVPW
jgi:hypothetical protein